MDMLERAASEAVELPVPSAALVLIRVFIVAYLATTTPKRAEAFLRESARLLESEQAVALMIPIRSASRYAEVAQARREAISLFREMLPTFVASLPKE